MLTRENYTLENFVIFNSIRILDRKRSSDTSVYIFRQIIGGHKSNYKIKIDLTEIMCEDADSTALTRVRLKWVFLPNRAKNLREAQILWNILTKRATINFFLAMMWRPNSPM